LRSGRLSFSFGRPALFVLRTERGGSAVLRKESQPVATLNRPKVTTYRLKNGAYRTPDGKRVTSKTPGAVRHESRSKTWSGRYTDANKEEHQVKLPTSKEIARRMLAKLAGDAQLASAGIADPFAEHRSRPILEHLEDYGRFVAGKDNTAKYSEQTVSMI